MDVIHSDNVLVFAEDKTIPFTWCWTCDPLEMLIVCQTTVTSVYGPCIKLPVPQCHLLTLLTYCSSITSVRVTWLSVEVIAGPCDASNLAHEISVCSHCCHANQFNREGRMAAHPRTTHAKHRADTQTRSHRSPLRSQMMGRDQSGGWQLFCCEWTWRIYWSVFSRRVEGTDAGGRGSEKVGEMYCTQCTLQMSAVL